MDAMFDGNLRGPFDKVVAPVGVALQKMGISPDFITAAGVVMSAGCALAIGTGHFFSAFILLALTGLPDALDGAVAKAGGTAGPRGAFLDSVSDRLSDGLIFAGAAFYFLDGDNPRMAMLPIALLIAAMMVSYMRAKAESLGYDAKGGLMERAERFIALGIGLAISRLFVPILWLMLGLTIATAIFRFIKVWRQASQKPPLIPAEGLSRTLSRRRKARDGSLAQRARAQRRNRLKR